jgi:hypothetical protein
MSDVPFLALRIADVGEGGELLSVAVPAGIEGENVFLKHPLKKPDRMIAFSKISQFYG